jgi:hypothetical protein
MSPFSLPGLAAMHSATVESKCGIPPPNNSYVPWAAVDGTMATDDERVTPRGNKNGFELRMPRVHRTQFALAASDNQRPTMAIQLCFRQTLNFQPCRLHNADESTHSSAPASSSEQVASRQAISCRLTGLCSQHSTLRSRRGIR